MTMSDLDVPDGTDERQLEAFLASLAESARNDVRRLILAGAPEAEVVERVQRQEELEEAETQPSE